MKSLSLTSIFFFITVICSAQINFNDYNQFKSQCENLNYGGIKEFYPLPQNSYYKGTSATPNFDDVEYLDTVIKVLGLTDDELKLLEQNHFMVTERLKYDNFGHAFHTIYANDLPVFISTDAILHALHSSYDYILKIMERDMLSANLEKFLKDLYDNIPDLIGKYTDIDESLSDVDLYVAVAYSLITNEKQNVRIVSQDKFDEVMEAISAEKPNAISLFCKEDRQRSIDFSQFKVRGHYVDNEENKYGVKSLEPYFRTMMWLGRISFLLTASAPNPWEPDWEPEEIQRMNISAYLLNGLIMDSPEKELLDINNKVINYLVGESDNITPDELDSYYFEKSINNVSDFNNKDVYANYYDGLSQNENFQQKILGNMLYVDPLVALPDVLPVVYLVSGQRFIIDSYVFSNVVYDRIIYNGKKVHRNMPNPLDAAFALGNNDALHFLQNEMEEYPYGANLAQIRYLIDQKDGEYWKTSLYNAWLGAIRELNPTEDDEGMPFFMKTSAWHQQKINTQLASWSQLRHDNLLYAKPSYTGMTGCSFPYSYVEPYPEFYASLSEFATNAGAFFSTIEFNSWELSGVLSYFTNFAQVMDKLEGLAQKELNNEKFSNNEETWLKSFLFESGGSGAPPYSGWFNELFVNRDDIIKDDFTIVDLHTQPTDENGVPVGKVLHAGVGKINCGVFLVGVPGDTKYVAYTGPFMSYYETITSNFLRYTDQDWNARVSDGDLPERPEWTNIYLADSEGNAKSVAVELPATFQVGKHDLALNSVVDLYPNPVNNFLNVRVVNTEKQSTYSIFDIQGKLKTESDFFQNTVIDFQEHEKGLYLLKIQTGLSVETYKILKK